MDRLNSNMNFSTMPFQLVNLNSYILYYIKDEQLVWTFVLNNEMEKWNNHSVSKTLKFYSGSSEIIGFPTIQKIGQM